MGSGAEGGFVPPQADLDFTLPELVSIGFALVHLTASAITFR